MAQWPMLQVCLSQTYLEAAVLVAAAAVLLLLPLLLLDLWRECSK
jgi:hypothetical protein